MHIIVRMPRAIEVEDMAYALHVQTPRRHIGRDEDIDLAFLKQVQFGDARRLVHVAMDLPAGETALLQILVEIAHGGLAVAEHDGGLHLVLFKQSPQLGLLGSRCDLDQALIDIGGCRGRARNLDMLGIGQEAVGQLLDRSRHRRRKQQRLPCRRQFGTDILDVGNEPHVEHAVRLVDHQQLAAVEEDLAPFEKIHQSAGRGDEHVDAFFQRLQLIAHGNTADKQRHVELVIATILLEIFGNLRGQFARRLQDQRPGHPRAAPPLGQNVDHRQHEARRLAGSGLRHTDNIAHHQHGWNRIGLNRGRLGIAGLIDRFQ